MKFALTVKQFERENVREQKNYDYETLQLATGTNWTLLDTDKELIHACAVEKCSFSYRVLCRLCFNY